MASSRPWITAHVLETVTGRPAQGISVTLTLLTPSSSSSSTPATFNAVTNTDGRITSWSSKTSTLESCIEEAKESLSKATEGKSSGGAGGGKFITWSLKFDTGSYYGEGKTFWPEVELKFATETTQEHYHVPLLLGPWSYTTYRGS